ncbi:unnamed protein product [Arctogadus glacialis]
MTKCKWSRKGFIRTRWALADCAFDLVNIHLFHDASNLVALEKSPSVYSGTRQKALGYVLDCATVLLEEEVVEVVEGAVVEGGFRRNNAEKPPKSGLNRISGFSQNNGLKEQAKRGTPIDLFLLQITTLDNQRKIRS